MRPMDCTRCNATGFLNLHQVDAETIGKFEETGDPDIVLDWILLTQALNDVQVCDCCGDGEDWYYEPGCHSSYEKGIGCR